MNELTLKSQFEHNSLRPLALLDFAREISSIFI